MIFLAIFAFLMGIWSIVGLNVLIVHGQPTFPWWLPPTDISLLCGLIWLACWITDWGY